MVKIGIAYEVSGGTIQRPLQLQPPIACMSRKEQEAQRKPRVDRRGRQQVSKISPRLSIIYNQQNSPRRYITNEINHFCFMAVLNPFATPPHTFHSLCQAKCKPGFPNPACAGDQPDNSWSVLAPGYEFSQLFVASYEWDDRLVRV